MPVLTADYEGCVCEIKTMQNDLLATGIVNLIEEDGIEIIGIDGEKLPLLHYNLPVKFTIFNNAAGFLMLAGTVYISSDWLLRIADPEELQNFERRMFFRINVETMARMRPIPNKEMTNEAIEATIEPIEVKLRDVSLGGFLFESADIYRMGDQFLVEFTLVSVLRKFRCGVKRNAGESVVGFRRFNRYGCTYLEPTTAQQDSLCRDLFYLQRVELKKKRDKI